MLDELSLKRIKNINDKFIEMGFDFEEDLIELFELREDIRNLLVNTKFKKINFNKDEESNSYIINLENFQISFDVIFGEDDEGLWYEVECHILSF